MPKTENAAVQDDTITAGEAEVTDIEDIATETLTDDKEAETDEDKPADSGKVKGDDKKVEATAADAEAKTADADKAKAKAADAKADEHNLKLPENSLLPPSTIEEISTFAKENGLSNEAAQKMLDRENAKMSLLFTQKREDLKPVIENWRRAAEKDPEIGGKDGSEFKANVMLAKRALDKANVPGLKETLDMSGFGNHPDMLKFCMFWGKTVVQDDKFETGSAGFSKTKKSAEQVFYGESS